MVVIFNSDQYPHTLQVKTAGVWVNAVECRDEPNNQSISAQADRINFIYSSLVFIPKNGVTLKKGQEMRVVGSDNQERLKGDVLRFSVDDFHCRIWV